MKYCRPGNTETYLVYIYFLENYLSDKLNDEHKKEIKQIYSHYIYKLYKSAGYYDKNIMIKKNMKLNENLNKYLKDILLSYQNSDIISLKFFTSIEKSKELKIREFTQQFRNFLNYKKEQYFWIFSDIFPYMNNKIILIISSFTELIEQQTNKLKYIYNDYPNSIKYKFLNFPYKFHNTGPHQNSFETLEYIKNQIKDIKFDVALLSCGSDAGILANYISEIGKDAFYIGGHLPLWFGILSERYKRYDINGVCQEMYNKSYDVVKEHLIENIPEKYRPDKYQEIEMGGYW